MKYCRAILAVILCGFCMSFLASADKKLVWFDEFNYRGLPDAKKWRYEQGYVRNKEMQFYTEARKENTWVEDGHLIIEARQDSTVIDGKIIPITSASLITQGKAAWTYGKIEVRAQIPSSLGSWPAIWMLGSDAEKLGWPRAGEIDIMEHVGFNPETIHTTIHTEASHAKKINQGKGNPVAHPYNDYHIYAIDWDKEKIDFLIDGKAVYSYANDGSGNASWPFDKPFYLILNLAFGGQWGGQKGVDVKTLPLKFYIDYVRVYQ